MPYILHEYRSVPPMDDEEVSCDVCGWGIDAERTHTTDQTVYTYTVTGTVHHHSDPTQVDKVVLADVPPWTNCHFCGSNKWQSGGKRGDL